MCLQPHRAAIISQLRDGQPLESNELQSTGLIKRHSFAFLKKNFFYSIRRALVYAEARPLFPSQPITVFNDRTPLKLMHKENT